MMQQILMAIGDNSVRLKDTASDTLRDAPVKRDHIVITPTRIPDPNIDALTLYSLARQTFRIDTIEDRLVFRGPSLMAWIGDGDNPKKGAWPAPPAVFARTFTQFVNTTLPSNGITIGTAFGSSGTSVLDSLSGVETARALFLRMHNKVGDEYRVNPDLSFDWGQPTSLWKSGANINLLLSETMDGLDADGIVGLKVVDRFRTTEDGSEFANYTLADAPGGLYGSSSTAADTTAADGTSAGVIAVYAQVSASESAPSSTSARQGELVRQYVDRFDVRCSVDCDDFGSYLTKGQPGDFVYLHGPRVRLEDLNTQVPFGGEIIYPLATHRILEFTTPVQEGMGVYHINSNSGAAMVASMTVTDWSDDIEFETGPTQLVLGLTPPLTLAQGINGSLT